MTAPTVTRVPSETREGVTYNVLMSADGQFATCTCPGWTFHGKDCKHIKEARNNMTTDIVPFKTKPPAEVLLSVDDYVKADTVAGYLIEARQLTLPKNLISTGSGNNFKWLPEAEAKANVRAVIIAGAELGLRPMTALRHMAIINGKAEPDGQALAGICMAMEPGLRFELVEENETMTRIRLHRPARGMAPQDLIYTMQDAQNAGITERRYKDNQGNWQVVPVDTWKKFPKDMRRWAIIKRLCRVFCPDLSNGIASSTYGEMPPAADLDAPDVIDAEVETKQDVIEAPVKPPAPPDDDDLFNPGDDPETPVQPDVEAEPAEETEEAPIPRDDGPRPQDQLTAALQRCMPPKGDWSMNDYRSLVQLLKARYTPDADRFRPANLTDAQATEATEEVLRQRGELEV